MNVQRRKPNLRELHSCQKPIRRKRALVGCELLCVCEILMKDHFILHGRLQRGPDEDWLVRAMFLGLIMFHPTYKFALLHAFRQSKSRYSACGRHGCILPTLQAIVSPLHFQRLLWAGFQVKRSLSNTKVKRTWWTIVSRHLAVETRGIEGRTADSARVLSCLPLPRGHSMKLLHFDSQPRTRRFVSVGSFHGGVNHGRVHPDGAGAIEPTGVKNSGRGKCSGHLCFLESEE